MPRAIRVIPTFPPMTIVHVIFSFGVGGAENLLVDILNEQVETASVSLLVVNRRYSTELLARIDPRVSVVLLDRTEGNRWNPLPILKCWLRLWALRPTVLHCHDHDLMKLLWPWRTRTVLTAHNVDIPLTFLPRYRQVYAISEAVRLDLAARGYPDSIIVLNGIDFAAFTRKTTYTSFQDKFRFIQVSRLLIEQKGQDVALRALHMLVHEQGHTGLTLAFVGEGPSLAYLQQLTHELGLEAQVEFLGSKDRRWVMENLHTYDALLQPSRFEGFGLTVLEGVAAGLPVVATDAEGPAEILRGLPTGFLFASEDSAALAGQLVHVIEAYRAGQLAPAAARAYAEAERRFSIQATAAHYLRLYPQ